MEITQAKKQRVQKSLSKVMRLHAGHAEFSNPISRQSSNTPCESMMISPHQNTGACKCCVNHSGPHTMNQSPERNLYLHTSKFSVPENDFILHSRNYNED